MGSINNFQALMKRAKGFARAARYEIVITPPAGSELLQFAGLSGDISLLCDSVTMPGHDLQSAAIKYGTGIATNMVTGHGYEGVVTATFYLDLELDVKLFMDAWQELAISTQKNTVSYYKNKDGKHNYAGSMEIYQLGSAGAVKTTYALKAEGPRNSEITKTVTDVEKINISERTYGVRVKEVFPATIGEIQYSYATANEMAKLTVGFQYRKWETILNLAKESSGSNRLQRK